MLDLKIDLLTLNIANAAGHEHRVQPIAAHAAALFAERLEERWANNGATRGAAALDSIAASPVSLNLAAMGDQEAASQIANAWLEALALKLKF
jgi:hypothetical protein